MQKNNSAEVMPCGVVNAYWFQGFNAISWSLLIGTPMLLYLKNLGASGTVLGITVSLLPFFSVLQIPAAVFAERVGYKTFVVRGWASRSIFILGIATVALWPDSMPPGIRITLMLLMMTCFAVVRGVSMCGYLPWITSIVPASLRGAFLSRDTMCLHLAVTATMLLSSFWVNAFPSSRAFGVLFLFSYFSSLAAVFFLRRIPDVAETERFTGTIRLPWKEMLFYPPFFKYVVFTVVFSVFVAGLGVIWVPFMRDSYKASGSMILGLSAYASIIAAVMSRLTGAVADRVGSRPLLGLSSGLIVIGQSLWMALSAGVIPHRTFLLFGITTFGATGFAILGVASMRLLMGLVPGTGRSHFFAIANVAASLTLGMFPVLWGVIFDLTGKIMPDRAQVFWWSWNRYSLLYAFIVAGLLASQYFRHRLDEPKAMPTEEFLHILFIKSPIRLVARVIQPLRRFLLPPG